MIISPLRGRINIDWRITQKFGERPEYYRKWGLAGHDGIDFASMTPGKKVPCYACYDGMVVFSGEEKNGFGKSVKILTDKDGNGNHRILRYAHLSKINVKEGERVYLGNQIGIIGNTGNSTGVHLHLSLKRLNSGKEVINGLDNFRGAEDFEKYLLENNPI